MSRTSSQSLVDETVLLLVKHFGAKRVHSALAKASRSIGDPSNSTEMSRTSSSASEQASRTTVPNMLELLVHADPEKHFLLKNFYIQLKERAVLPESQDIRHFAQRVGIKEIGGKSRKEMIPGLMRFLCDQPIGQLRVEIESAATVSEEQRQRGFAVLTDKLLGEKHVKER
jgi:hypothetical protein